MYYIVKGWVLEEYCIIKRRSVLVSVHCMNRAGVGGVRTLYEDIDGVLLYHL